MPLRPLVIDYKLKSAGSIRRSSSVESIKTGKMILFLTLSSLISSVWCARVAIVGAGIGGTSTAYFLKQLKGDQVEIDIYEGNRVGGRLATFQWQGENYEIGGTIIHPDNRYMNLFLKETGLEKKPSCPETFGVFNETELLFRSSDYNVVTLFKLLWRYGPDFPKMTTYVNEVMKAFERLYDVNEPGYPATTTNELLALTNSDLVEFLNISTTEGLKVLGYSNLFVNELIAGILNCNYCQSPGMHLFVGSVAVAGADINLWSVQGGNFRVAEELVKISEANLINKQVETVKYAESKFVISGNFADEVYDYVVLAAPLNSRNRIEFEDFETQPERDNYHKTFCTLVQAWIKPEFFNYYDLPDTLLFTNNYTIKALSKIHPVNRDCSDLEVPIWKIFSDEILSNEYLDRIFEDYHVISTTDWLAYPEYSSVAKDKSFYLFDPSVKVYYVNAVEALASAMEMSAIGGNNVAYLISNDIDEIVKSNPENEYDDIYRDREEL